MKKETWLKRFAHINLHQKPKITPKVAPQAPKCSTFWNFPRPFPMAMAFLSVMLINGRPWTCTQKEEFFRVSSPIMVERDHFWKTNREPFTFHVVSLKILAICSCLVNLRRNLFGPITAKEKGTAKSQALMKATFTNWLLWVYCEIR